MIVLSVLGLQGCDMKTCGCPAPSTPPLRFTALIACGVQPANLQVTGPCTASEQASQVDVVVSGAGDCHLEVSFTNGFLYATNLHFENVTLTGACGSCGQSLEGTQDFPMTIDPCADGGEGGAPGDANSTDGASD